MTFSRKKSVDLAFAVSVVLVCGACCDQGAIPEATRRLYSSVARERNEAALELARCGAAAGKAVPVLGTMLYDQNVGVQSSAAYALRQIDTPEARRILAEAEARRSKR